MRNYTTQDIKKWYWMYEKHISHVIVAHTKFRPFYRRSKQHLDFMLLETQKSCGYALNCFNKLLYPSAPNKPIRQPHLYRPLTFVTTEGAKETTDRSLTVHVNITLGNLPRVLTTEDIETLFRHTWHNMAKQGTNIYVSKYYRENWELYSLKEGEEDPSRLWGDDSIWDVGNCWIPLDAINED